MFSELNFRTLKLLKSYYYYLIVVSIIDTTMCTFYCVDILWFGKLLTCEHWFCKSQSMANRKCIIRFTIVFTTFYTKIIFFFIYRQVDENYTSSIQLMYLFYFIHYTYFWKQYNIMIIRCVYHLKNWNCLTFLRACKTCFCFVQKMCLMCCYEIILILRKVKFHFLPDRLLCILFFL